MARSSNQKLKPLYIMEYLLRNTDEEHPGAYRIRSGKISVTKKRRISGCVSFYADAVCTILV